MKSNALRRLTGPNTLSEVSAQGAVELKAIAIGIQTETGNERQRRLHHGDQSLPWDI